MESLFNIELYYCTGRPEEENKFYLLDDEYHHAVKVMRCTKGGRIFSTDGKGKIFEGRIEEISGNRLSASVLKIHIFDNPMRHLTLCVPNLRNPERLKFTLEKCTELGITDFIVFSSERTIKKPFNLGRHEKILISAMKQSLRAFLPAIAFSPSLSAMIGQDKINIVFDQKSEVEFSGRDLSPGTGYRLIFGPEGSLTDEEINLICPDKIFNLGKFRLRSETAVIKAVSVISGVIK